MVAGQCVIVVAVDTSPSLTRLVMLTARRARRARGEALAPYGLTPHQGGAFLAVAHFRMRHPETEMKQADLARALRITPRSATEVVDALCDRGLLTRRPSSTDRRATSLVLTPAGEEVLTAIGAANPGEEVFAALTAEERATLATLLSKVLAAERA